MLKKRETDKCQCFKYWLKVYAENIKELKGTLLTLAIATNVFDKQAIFLTVFVKVWVATDEPCTAFWWKCGRDTNQRGNMHNYMIMNICFGSLEENNSISMFNNAVRRICRGDLQTKSQDQILGKKRKIILVWFVLQWASKPNSWEKETIYFWMARVAARLSPSPCKSVSRWQKTTWDRCVKSWAPTPAKLPRCETKVRYPILFFPLCQ